MTPARARRPRIVIADDHALVCEGLRALLEPAYDVVAMMHDGREVLATVARTHPDLVLLDISLPGRNGLEIARDLRALRPTPRVVMLTMHAERVYADEAFRAGASGFLLKLATESELRFAVSEVLAGRTYLTPSLARAASAGQLLSPEVPRALDGQPLTPRQIEVLRLVGRGLTSAEIAEQLDLSQKAVEFHKSRIRRALGLRSTAALVRYAVSQGLL